MQFKTCSVLRTLPVPMLPTSLESSENCIYHLYFNNMTSFSKAKNALSHVLFEHGLPPKKSRNLFSFDCNTSLWAICRSFPVLLFLPAVTKESTQLRKPLKGHEVFCLVLHGPCHRCLGGLLLQTRYWGKAIMLECGGRLWARITACGALENDMCLACPWHPCWDTRGVPRPVHAWHVSQGRTEATEAAREHNAGSS